MIHTFEIIRQLNPEQLNLILAAFRAAHYDVSIIFNPFTTRPVVRICNFSTGFKRFIVFRRGEFPNFEYYAVIRLEPQMILENRRTIQLFRATELYVRDIRCRFSDVMSRFLGDPDSSLTNLAEWNCRRIDYTININFEQISDLNLFLEMTKKTSRHIRKKLKRMDNIPIREQSTAEGNGSVKVMFYDKCRQVYDVYNSISPTELRQLLYDSRSIVRYEIQCKSRKIQTLKRKYGFDNRSILNYLNEDIAHELLMTEYLNSVGRGDFYSIYHAKKIIRESDLSNCMKNKLVNFLMLIAKSRHISVAEEHFIEGKTHIQHNHKKVLVKGSKNTFRQYRKSLEDLGINPMLIPQAKRTIFLRNPILQVERGY